jgi:chromate transporter
VNAAVPIQIFLTFLKISFISFGGVVGVLPVLERMVVVDHQWMTHEAFIQSYVLAQFAPGPNVALCPLLGYRIAGWPGFAAGFFGIFGPPLLIMGVAYVVYHRYRDVALVKRVERSLRPLVLGLVASSGAQIWWAQTSATGHAAWVTRGLAFALTVGGYLLLRQKRVQSLLLIVAVGIIWVGVIPT